MMNKLAILPVLFENFNQAIPGSKKLEICSLFRIAVQTDNRWLVDTLSRLEVDFNTTFRNFSPLLFAIDQGSPALVQKLIQGGADVNLVVGQLSPLTLARRSNRPDIVKVLSENGATVESYPDNIM